jgi:hypothetical protein
MLSSIKFDHDLLFDTCKISNEFPDGVLATEAVTVNLFVA